MASAISSRIGSLCGNFMGSSKCLSSDATTITREGRSCKRKDTCRVCFTSQWKPSSGLNQGNQKVARESEFSSVALNASTGSACPEEWWRRASQTQIGQPSLFPCKAFDTQSTFPALSASDWHPDRAFSPESTVATKVYSLRETNTSRGSSGGVPVYVMLPLDSISVNNTVNRRRAMNASLLALKSAGVEGVMMDVWWGLVERDEPGKYNWSGYKELIDMVKKHGLKIQAVMSFHQCGGNVGDSCCIPLPKWVVEEMDRDPNFAYTDKHGRRNYEYISLGCGTLPVLKGRTPVQAYADYMRSFRDNFKDLLGDTVVEIQVGMGPAGELRYPSYPESNGTWRFPGIGEFQCYDKYMLASLQAAADRKGKKEWGQGGPGDAGHYNNWPEETDFFRREGGWKSPYGEFLLGWYSDMLLAHGERILTAAEGIFRGTGAKLSGKVAGIHWHYGTRSHGPELTAGYYNTRFKDGYLPIARMFGRHGVVLNFTCIEMRDIEQPSDAQCSPEKLIKQVVLAARKAGVSVAGENALPRFDEAAHRQVVRNSRLKLQGDPHDAAVEPMCAFTFLRMNQALFQTENWRHFVPFVRQMAEGRTFNEWEEEHRATESFVHATRPLVQEAEAAMAYS